MRHPFVPTSRDQSRRDNSGIRTMTLRLTAAAFALAASAVLPSAHAQSTAGTTQTLAMLSTDQMVAGDAVFRGGAVASVGNDALRDAYGNIGVNLAAGALNAQSNQIALVSATSTVVNTRQTVTTTASVNGNLSASLGAGALAGASGNIGVNVAAGVGNAQSNSLAIH